MKIHFLEGISYKIVSFSPFAKQGMKSGAIEVPDQLIHEYQSAWERFWNAQKALKPYAKKQKTQEAWENRDRPIECNGKIRRSGSLVTLQDVAPAPSTSTGGSTSEKPQGSTSGA